MRVTLPMQSQPYVGKTVTVPVTGKVISVYANPQAPTASQIMVELEVEAPLGEEQEGFEEFMSKNDNNRSFTPMQVAGIAD